MTEEEAKRTWCHKTLFAHTQDPEAAAGNWGWDGKCLGSGCMAWRWDAYSKGKPRLPTDEGYCGLAGAP